MGDIWSSSSVADIFVVAVGLAVMVRVGLVWWGPLVNRVEVVLLAGLIDSCELVVNFAAVVVEAAGAGVSWSRDAMQWHIIRFGGSVSHMGLKL